MDGGVIDEGEFERMARGALERDVRRVNAARIGGGGGETIGGVAFGQGGECDWRAGG